MTVDGTTLNVTVPGLSGHVNYTIKVRAANSAGWSRYSLPVSVLTPITGIANTCP